MEWELHEIKPQLPTTSVVSEPTATLPKAASTLPSSSQVLNTVCSAGKLQEYVDKWKEITTDKFILNSLSGYKIPFNSLPKQVYEPNYRYMSDQEIKIIDESIKALLITGAIQYASENSEQFLSTVFVVPKASGGNRLVINLKTLNTYITAPHFKMEDIRSALHLISQNDYLAVVDQKDAYHRVPIHNEHRKYLRFIWKMKVFEFTCLPFGINVAPFLFTKLMKPILGNLRAKGFLSVSYLDDCLLIGSNSKSCEENIQSTINLMTKMGLEVNMKKSQIIPSKEVRFLGFILNTKTMTISLPKEKQDKIIKLCRDLKSRDNISIQELSILIGNLVASLLAVPYGMCHLRQIEFEKITALKQNDENYSASMVMSREGKLELDWWENNIKNCTKSFLKKGYDLTITTDASLSGWGAVSDDRTANGHWTAEQATFHINVLELMAIYYGLLTFSPGPRLNILIRTDSITALSYINNSGSCSNNQCHKIAMQIWKWCETRNIVIVAAYVNTKFNVVADQLSRAKKCDYSDFMLGANYFRRICKLFFLPVIDLFASHNTKQCDAYVSWKPDPGASHVDAFTIKWPDSYYAFPPFNLISRVLSKVLVDKSKGIIVAPYWPTQSWFPLFLKLCQNKFVILKPSNQLLFCPYLNRAHQLSTRTSLVVAVLQP